MAKLLVTGDFHIKEKFIEELTPQFNLILKDIHTVDAVCIAGDIFDHPKPSSIEICTFINFITSIPNKIPIYIIAGNHDWVDKQNAAIDWVPYIRPNVYYHHNSLDFTIASKKVKMLHCNVSESIVGPEDISLPGGSISQYTSYDIVILGHIHKAQIIKKSKLLALHPGSLIYTTFGERNDTKGYYLVHIGDTIVPEFIKTNPIPMYQFIIDNPKDSLEKINKINKNSKVKIIFKGNINSLEFLKNIENTIKVCSKKFREFKYEIISTDKGNIEVKQKTQLNLKELLQKFYKKEKVDKKIQQLMNKYIIET